jgi:hypothetical protein
MMLNIVVDHPEARSLPSRHRFALARLIGYLRLRESKPAAHDSEHLILSIDRDQTAIEMHLVALWVFVTTTFYIAAALPFALPLSTILAIPLAAIAIHLPIVIGGPLLRLFIGDGNHIKIISVTTMALLLIASSYAATTASWARFVAWLCFAILLINCLAAAILWLLRDAVQAAEEQCVR